MHCLIVVLSHMSSYIHVENKLSNLISCKIKVGIGISLLEKMYNNIGKTDTMDKMGNCLSPTAHQRLIKRLHIEINTFPFPYHPGYHHHETPYQPESQRMIWEQVMY